ncbi:hypothetical protein ON010_g711 [Phytophthora cinnamomi]|nr:hypothetical protein ON010_g711 [Phytophthora cinnamomi]
MPISIAVPNRIPPVESDHLIDYTIPIVPTPNSIPHVGILEHRKYCQFSIRCQQQAPAPTNQRHHAWISPRQDHVGEEGGRHVDRGAPRGPSKGCQDKLSTIINEWKSSDRVQYTKGGNPKQPSVTDVAQWVETVWKDVPDDVVTWSVAPAEFAPCCQDWHISRHDVYGEVFCRKWISRDDDSDDNDVEEDLLENLDEFTIWDSEDSV